MRHLDWDGQRNIRDLGGLPTPLSPTGKTLMSRVARGPRRELLTSAGWASAKRWGLRSVVDLRNADEVGPRRFDPAASPPETVKITLAPTEDPAQPEFRAICLPILDSPEYWQHNVRLLPELVRGALEAIADSEPGVLVHCSAGRDRTGMVSALLLANAGVPSEEIVTDYAQSVQAMAGTSAHGGPAHDRQASWTPEQTETWLSNVTTHVRTFISDLEPLLDDLEVRSETRSTLRALLTT